MSEEGTGVGGRLLEETPQKKVAGRMRTCHPGQGERKRGKREKQGLHSMKQAESVNTGALVPKLNAYSPNHPNLLVKGENKVK